MRRPFSSASARGTTGASAGTRRTFSSARPTAVIRSQAGANPTFLPGQTVSNSRGRFENPAYSVYDASFGVAKDAWYLNVYCENLSNSNASVFVSTDQFIVAQTPLRPRVLGAAFGYKF